MSILFIGNFVNDVIVKKTIEGEIVSFATGGSVTYGSIAASTFGSYPSILSNVAVAVADDLPKGFLQSLQDNHLVNLDGVQLKEGKSTSYRLEYALDGRRTLKLEEKGFDITIDDVINAIEKKLKQGDPFPDAIFFVPVAAEFDENLVLQVMNHFFSLGHISTIVAFDVQGFIRSFRGRRVVTRSKEKMMLKLKTLASISISFHFPTILKTEYGEATAILGNLTPVECARTLRDLGFTIVSVTMGGLGSYLSTALTGEVYIPTFKPERVADETGCGDTFLTCFVLELLQQKMINFHSSIPLTGDTKNVLEVTSDQVVLAAKVGSSAASFLVERVGPNGFQKRDTILERVKNGIPTQPPVEFSSVTIYKPKK